MQSYLGCKRMQKKKLVEEVESDLGKKKAKVSHSTSQSPLAGTRNGSVHTGNASGGKFSFMCSGTKSNSSVKTLSHSGLGRAIAAANAPQIDSVNLLDLEAQRKRKKKKKGS